MDTNKNSKQTSLATARESFRGRVADMGSINHSVLSIYNLVPAHTHTDLRAQIPGTDQGTMRTTTTQPGREKSLEEKKEETYRCSG